MRSPRPTRLALFALAPLVALLLAGCGLRADDAATALSDAEASALAEATVSEMERIASTATVDGTTSATLTASDDAAQRERCVTLSGDTSDADGDGVPADATATFDCSAVGIYGGSASLTGAVDIADPSDTVGGFDATIRDLTVELRNVWQDRNWREVRNGTRSPRLTGDTLTLSHSITSVRDYDGRWVTRDVTVQNDLELTFVASGGATIDMGAPLPSGSFDGTGSLAFDRDRVDAAFAFEITDPLVFDAGCDAYPRFTGGTLVLEGSSDARADRTVTLVYGGCGVDPEVTLTTP